MMTATSEQIDNLVQRLGVDPDVAMRAMVHGLLNEARQDLHIKMGLASSWRFPYALKVGQLGINIGGISVADVQRAKELMKRLGEAYRQADPAQADLLIEAAMQQCDIRMVCQAWAQARRVLNVAFSLNSVADVVFEAERVVTAMQSGYGDARRLAESAVLSLAAGNEDRAVKLIDQSVEAETVLMQGDSQVFGPVRKAMLAVIDLQMELACLKL